MTQIGQLFLVVIVIITISDSNSQLGLGFDGFVTFLKEMGKLKTRLQNVQETGRTLNSRAEALEAAILKMNMSVGNSIGKVTFAMDKTFHLKSRVQNISTLVETTKNNMTKLQKLSNATTSSRRELNDLAENKNMVIDNLIEKVTSLQTTVVDLQNATDYLQIERIRTEDLYEDMVNTTGRVEQMGCDSGFGYEDSSFPSTTKIRFQRPFSSTPKVLYGMTQLHRTRDNSYSGYTLIVNVTQDGIDENTLTMRMKKSDRTSLNAVEFNWMACDLQYVNITNNTENSSS